MTSVATGIVDRGWRGRVVGRDLVCREAFGRLQEVREVVCGRGRTGGMLGEVREGPDMVEEVGEVAG